jgi:hypothetical protein
VNEPSSLDSEAVTWHEMYQSFIRAGFTRQEALELVKVGIAEVFRRGAADSPAEQA